MTKRIGLLGGGGLSAAMAFALTNRGHEVMIEDKPVKRKNYAPLDLSDYKKPVNGYQQKQRKRKAKRKLR